MNTGLVSVFRGENTGFSNHDWFTSCCVLTTSCQTLNSCTHASQRQVPKLQARRVDPKTKKQKKKNKKKKS
jgi:hypothetical protein